MGKISIGVLGSNGRMGQVLMREIAKTQNCEAYGATRGDNIKAFFEKAHVVIDFTAPSALENHLTFANDTKTPLMVGTTGLESPHKILLEQAAKNSPLFYATNTSVAIALLNQALAQVAEQLDDGFEIEIIDRHHAHKKDAPSGTALGLEETIKTHRPSKTDVHFSITREGNITGEHQVIFKNQYEELSFTHKAFDRALFAKGALKAALWLRDKPAGLYGMKDLLGS